MQLGDWIFEIKFDGYRALALRGGNETRVLSRNKKDLGSKFKEIKDSIAALDVQDVIIDGEIVALDEKGRASFQLLQAFAMGQERPPIVFYAFDLLQLNGQDLKYLPIEERKAKLEALLKKPAGVIRYSVSFTKRVEELLSRVRELGLEGLIGKRRVSRYEAGKRSGTWVKIKLYQEQEFVIGGYTEPEAARKYFGALLVGVYEGKRLKDALIAVGIEGMTVSEVKGPSSMTTSVRWKAIGTGKEYKRGSELGVSSSCGYADTGGPDASLRRELSR